MAEPNHLARPHVTPPAQGAAAAPAQNWDASLYEDKHSFVWKYGADLIELLAPKPGERILDLGSGTGHLAARIAEAGASVVGIDASPEMVEQARRNYVYLRFEVGDARRLEANAEFVAVFSNATLHWVKPPGEAVRCIARALKGGGRFVAEFGGHGNVRAVVDALVQACEEAGVENAARLNPWYYPTVGEYAALLEGHGLEVAYATLFDRPTAAEGEDGMANWLRMFGGPFFNQVAEVERENAIRRAEEILRPKLYRQGVWYVDYRRLKVMARKTG
jgi:trans-aconitate methyltransferase